MNQTTDAACFFCRDPGGDVLHEDDRLRIIAPAESDYPGFLRVVWRAHVREMTDLSASDRAHCMRAVFAAERALRDVLHPGKINLASFGNVVPHLHWHVIPRHDDDPHFPNPVWGTRLRDTPRPLPAGALDALRARIAEALR
ncbi:MAG: HIT family protein [Burkholderiales bacterium]